MVATAADGMSDNRSRARSACKFVDIFPSRHPGEVSDTIAKADKLLSDQGLRWPEVLGVPTPASEVWTATSAICFSESRFKIRAVSRRARKARYASICRVA